MLFGCCGCRAVVFAVLLVIGTVEFGCCSCCFCFVVFIADAVLFVVVLIVEV